MPVSFAMPSKEPVVESNFFENNVLSDRLLIDDTPEDEAPRGCCARIKGAVNCVIRFFCRKQVLMCIAIVSAIVLAAIYNKQVSAALNQFKGFCKTNPTFAPILFAGAVAGLTIVMMPTVTLFVGAGYLFPAIYREDYGNVSALVIGIASVSGGLSIGSLIAFALGRSCFREWAEEELSTLHFMKVVNKMVEAQGWWIVFLARMSPLMPAEVFNYVCSLTNISLGGFAFGSLGSVAPIAIWIVSSAAGFDAANQADGKQGHATDNTPQDNDPHAKQRKLLFIAANVVFLFVISYPMYRAFKKFEREAYETVSNMTAEEQETNFGATLSFADKKVLARRASECIRTPTEMDRRSSKSFPSGDVLPAAKNT